MMFVVYYIITMILTKELVMAIDDQCGMYCFKSPFHLGESCETISTTRTLKAMTGQGITGLVLE